jgi:hypothetical protein
MAKENPLWGQERIANELWLKLGVRVSPRTVRKYLPRAPAGCPRGDQRWSTFLKNHAQAIVACDFLVTVTCGLRLLYVLVVMEHGSRRLIHYNVTAHPTALWTRQQLREALGYETRYRYLVHDRDKIFSWQLDNCVESFGLRVLKNAAALSDGKWGLRTGDRHDPPRVSGLAHPTLRSASAACPKVLDRRLQSRSPTHGARAGRARSSSCPIEVKGEVSS